MDRQALALMESGELRESAELFATVADRQGEDTLNRVRALRNRGVALHRMSLRLSGIERELARRQAETSLTQAAELIRSPRLVVEPEISERGDELFTLRLTLETGTDGAAQQGFTVQEEERLLSAALARVRLEGGEPETGIEELRSFLAVEPKLDDGNRAYYTTARLVALDQLARELARAGRPEEAFDALVEGIEGARFLIGKDAQYNGGGLSRMLARLAELELGPEAAVVKPDALRGTWLGETIGSGDGAAVVDAMIARALALRSVEDGPHVIDQESARGRLTLARALLAEREASRGGVGRGRLGDLRSAAALRRAEVLAQRLIRDAETGDIGRRRSSDWPCWRTDCACGRKVRLKISKRWRRSPTKPKPSRGRRVFRAWCGGFARSRC
jgi:tetratricopeptide (TPR) repeat protein